MKTKKLLAILIAALLAFAPMNAVYATYNTSSETDQNALTELENLLAKAENARDNAEELLNDTREIIDENDLTHFEYGVDEKNIGDVADIVDAAANAVNTANDAVEQAQTAIDTAEEAIAIAETVREAAETAIKAAADAIGAAEEAIEAANEAIEAAHQAEEKFLEALNTLDDIEQIRQAEAEMIARRSDAIAAQVAAEEAIASKTSAETKAWNTTRDALSTAIAAYAEAVRSFEKAVTAEGIEAAAGQRLEAEQAVIEALEAQLYAFEMIVAANAAVDESNAANTIAETVIEATREAITHATNAAEAANAMADAVNKIITDVEDFIIDLITNQPGINDLRDAEDATFVDYVAFYYNFLREMAQTVFGVSNVGEPKSAEQFRNMTTAEFNAVLDTMNGWVEVILKHNAEAHAEYLLILEALEAAFRRAADGTPEAALSVGIPTANPITPITGGSNFTTEFRPHFENLLINFWTENRMHQDRDLKEKASEIADRGVLLTPGGQPWQMQSVTAGNRTTPPTFVPNGDGTFTFTTTWNVRADQQQSDRQYQQIIAIDWNRPANQGGGVISFVWILEGIYAPGQEINLIFTEEMVRSIQGYNANNNAGGTIVIKRIAFPEDLDSVVLQQLQSLPTTFATTRGAPAELDSSVLDVKLNGVEFAFAGFSMLGELPDRIPEETPTEEDPTEEVPTEEDPTEEDPTEEDPTEEDPTEEDPTEEDPTEENPTEEDPTEEVPTEENPTEDPPAIENPPVITLPPSIDTSTTEPIPPTTRSPVPIRTPLTVNAPPTPYETNETTMELTIIPQPQPTTQVLFPIDDTPLPLAAQTPNDENHLYLKDPQIPLEAMLPQTGLTNMSLVLATIGLYSSILLAIFALFAIRKLEKEL